MVKFLKEEKGTITGIVLISLLFFLIILSTMFITYSAHRKAQLKSQVIVKEIYEDELKQAPNILEDYKYEI